MVGEVTLSPIDFCASLAVGSFVLCLVAKEGIGKLSVCVGFGTRRRVRSVLFTFYGLDFEASYQSEEL